jgi:hypothetical protein
LKFSRDILGFMWTKETMLEAMKRPLFEEPSPACERPDPFHGPKGFMLGGMCWPTDPYKDTAQQYFDAANVLISKIERNEFEDYRLSNPILYLYRHWLELMVKAIVGRVREHNLERLAERLDSYLQDQGVTLPKWVVARFKEVAAMDDDSTVFRYAERYIPDEVYVSLPHLKRAMGMLNIVLLALVETGELPHGSIPLLMLERGYGFDKIAP